MLAGGGDRSDWVRNLRAGPQVTVRIRRHDLRRHRSRHPGPRRIHVGHAHSCSTSTNRATRETSKVGASPRSRSRSTSASRTLTLTSAAARVSRCRTRCPRGRSSRPTGCRCPLAGRFRSHRARRGARSRLPRRASARSTCMRFFTVFGSGTLKKSRCRTPRWSGASQAHEVVAHLGGFVAGHLRPERRQCPRIGTVERDVEHESGHEALRHFQVVALPRSAVARSPPAAVRASSGDRRRRQAPGRSAWTRCNSYPGTGTVRRHQHRFVLGRPVEPERGRERAKAFRPDRRTALRDRRCDTAGCARISSCNADICMPTRHACTATSSLAAGISTP